MASLCFTLPSVFGIRRYPFTQLDGERHCDRKVSCLTKKAVTHPGLEPGPLDPESSALTILGNQEKSL